MPKTIAWVINRFDQIGGGERLIQEGARYYRSIGYRVLIVTWHYGDEVLFNGEYEKRDIINLGGEEVARANILRRAWSRARSLPKLRATLGKYNVSRVFVQGEYDVALTYLALMGSRLRYRFLIFGQIFQYPHDNAKYALVFRRHLSTIVNSCRGYSETITLTAPKLNLPNRLANEFISVIRWFAVRSAERRFTFSNQVDWETGVLFGVDTARARGAFRRKLLSAAFDGCSARSKYGLEKGKYVLSLSRLDRKKRIDVIIAAFCQSSLDPEIVLVIAGGGNDEAFLREVARNHDHDRRIKFVGLVAEPDLLPLKQDCAVFVSMDIGDYDISPLEALAVGRPVICPTEFDVDDVLQACPGFHICEADPESLSEKLAEVMTTPQPDCRETIGELSWEAYFDTLNRD